MKRPLKRFGSKVGEEAADPLRALGLHHPLQGLDPLAGLQALLLLAIVSVTATPAVALGQDGGSAPDAGAPPAASVERWEVIVLSSFQDASSASRMARTALG